MKDFFILVGPLAAVIFGVLVNVSSPDSPAPALIGGLVLAAWAYGNGYTYAKERYEEEA